MAITLSNIHRESVGSLWALSGTFTTGANDSSLAITHGFYYVANADIQLSAGGLNTPNPKITHTAGIATFVVDSTQSYSGTFYIVGR